MNAYITYFGYFGWLVLLAYVQNRLPRLVKKQELVQEKTVTRYNWVFAFLAAAPLVILAARRGNNIGDTIVYRNGFYNAASSFSAIPNYVAGVRKDKAFYFFAAFWRTVLGYRPVVYFGIIALFHILCMTKTLRKYTPYLLTAFFIFVASTDYIAGMQNGIRQFVAVCIIFSCSNWIFEKKYIQAIIAILIASLFHQSALVMIPVIFVVQGEPWNKSTVAILFTTILVLMFIDRFTNILDNMLAETQYSNVVEDWTSINDNGTNPIRVLVYSVPTILSLIGLPYIRETDNRVINVCVNMSVITSSLYLISMMTSGIFMGRLPIYTSLYSSCILLPWEVNTIFSKRSESVVRAMLIVLFILFYYYQVHFTWGFF